MLRLLKFFSVFIFLIMFCCAETALNLQNFLNIAKVNNIKFQQILLNEISLKYTKIMKLPARDIVFEILPLYTLNLSENSSEFSFNSSLSKLFPQTGTAADADYNMTHSPASGAGSSKFLLQFIQPVIQNSFGATYKIDEKIADIEYEIMRYQLIETYEDYLAGLIKLYYSWFSHYTSLKLNQQYYYDNLDLYNNTLKKATRNIARKEDVNRAYLQLLNSREQYLIVSNSYIDTYMTVKEALNDKSTNQYIPVLSFPMLPMIGDLAFEITQFTNNSRTCQIFNKKIKTAGFNIENTKQDMLPSANLILGFSLNGDNAFFKDSETEIFAGVKISHRFFSFKEKAAFELSMLNDKKEKLTVEEERQTIINDLKYLYSSISLYNQLAGIYEEKVIYALEIYELDKKYYNQGRISMSELTDSRNDYQKFEFDKLKIDAELNIHKIEWFRFTDNLVKKNDLPFKNFQK